MSKLYYSSLFVSLVTLFSFVLSSCKPFGLEEPTSNLAAIENPNLTLADFEELKRIDVNECLIEVKHAFNQFDRISQTVAPKCIPAVTPPQIAWRGRIDVDWKKEKVEPLALTVLMDSSGSLVKSDPNDKRFKGFNDFMDMVEIAYKDNYDKLAMKVIFFTYGVQSDTPDKVFAASDVDFARFKRNLKTVRTLTENRDNQTNYLNAFQNAIEFYENSPGLTNFPRRMILFTDGMPWSEKTESTDDNYSKSMSNTCRGQIENVVANGRHAPSSYGLDFNLQACIDIGLIEPERPRTRPNHPGLRVGLSETKTPTFIDGQLDPANFRMAMLHHIKFADKVLRDQHSIFLEAIYFHPEFDKQKRCWEQLNTPDTNFKDQFQYLCEQASFNDFFANLVEPSQGEGRKHFYPLSDINKLTDIFTGIVRGFGDFEYEQVLYRYFDSSKNQVEDFGEVCGQNNTTNFCPLKKGDPKNRDGVSDGQYNFHLFFNKYFGGGFANLTLLPEAIIPQTPPGIDPGKLKFSVSHNLQFSDAAPQDCGFEFLAESDDGSGNFLIQDEDDTARYTCRYQGKPKHGCVPGGKGKGGFTICEETVVVMTPPGGFAPPGGTPIPTGGVAEVGRPVVVVPPPVGSPIAEVPVPVGSAIVVPPVMFPGGGVVYEEPPVMPPGGIVVPPPPSWQPPPGGGQPPLAIEPPPGTGVGEGPIDGVDEPKPPTFPGGGGPGGSPVGEPRGVGPIVPPPTNPPLSTPVTEPRAYAPGAGGYYGQTVEPRPPFGSGPNSYGPNPPYVTMIAGSYPRPIIPYPVTRGPGGAPLPPNRVVTGFDPFKRVVYEPRPSPGSSVNPTPGGGSGTPALEPPPTRSSTAVSTDVLEFVKPL